MIRRTVKQPKCNSFVFGNRIFTQTSSAKIFLHIQNAPPDPSTRSFLYIHVILIRKISAEG